MPRPSRSREKSFDSPRRKAKRSRLQQHNHRSRSRSRENSCHSRSRLDRRRRSWSHGYRVRPRSHHSQSRSGSDYRRCRSRNSHTRSNSTRYRLRSHSNDRYRTESKNNKRRSRSRRNRTRKRSCSDRSVTGSPKHKDSVQRALGSIISRLNAIEASSRDSVHSSTPPCPSTSQSESALMPATQVLADALQSITKLSKSANYYVSNFDPAINSFEVGCDEVERARLTNNWGDSECLSRVALCLKGDVETWLNEWITNDRSWSNFIREFKCPQKTDYAEILCEVINTSSDKYPAYAEYARRLLLRLQIVQGLSNDLRVLIVIRGISDVQVQGKTTQAAAHFMVPWKGE